MFILNLTYTKSLSEIDRFAEQHIAFLDKFYEERNFIVSGRKIPRTGGVIFLNAEDLEEVNRIISQDPFYINGLASYEIIEFEPVKWIPGFFDFID